MKNVLWFKELNRNSLAEAGGKGANLGEMYDAGFPIPNGFVTTSGAYFKFHPRNCFFLNKAVVANYTHS